MANNSTPQTPPPAPAKPNAPPPEAYAAYVRLLLEWACTEGDEQATIAEKAVKKAGKNHQRILRIFTNTKAASNPEYSLFGKAPESTLYGLVFDEYVSAAWIDWMEFSSSQKGEKDVTSFAEWIDREFQRYKVARGKFDKEISDFIEQTEKEWDSALDSQVHLSDEAFDKYMDQELEKKKQEYERLKSDFIKYHHCFPDLTDTLAHSTFNTIQRSFSALCPKPLKKPPIDYISVQDSARFGILVERVRNALDDENREIFNLLLFGYSKKEIAERLGISPATVYNRINKMKPIVKSVI